jgi:hypothetical protein
MSDRDKLLLDELDAQIEFQFATYQAIENMEFEFEFHGYTVLTLTAIDAVNEMVESRTYH